MKWYYDLKDHVNKRGRWFLASPISIATGEEIDPRIFTEANIIAKTESMYLPLRRPGTPLDITFADFDMIVVTASVALVLETATHDEIQSFPISVEQQAEEYRILNIKNAVECIDKERSLIQWWGEADGRPEKVGMPEMIVELKIDPEKAANHKIFRVATWKIAPIVSHEIKTLLEKMKVTGVRFEPVCD